MGGILAENQYVEREMKRRDFELVNGQWQDGVLLEGDPQSDADLEPFLRTQFRIQQEEARAAVWGGGAEARAAVMSSSKGVHAGCASAGLWL